MKKLLFVLALISASFAADAQTAIGIRGGYSGLGDGLSIKQYTGENGALEGFLSFATNRIALSVLWEMHKPMKEANGLYFEYGVGPYLSLFDNPLGSSEIDLGATGIVGLEYRFPEFPFSVGLDYNPSLEIVNDFDMDLVRFSAAIRYFLK